VEEELKLNSTSEEIEPFFNLTPLQEPAEIVPQPCSFLLEEEFLLKKKNNSSQSRRPFVL